MLIYQPKICFFIARTNEVAMLFRKSIIRTCFILIFLSNSLSHAQSIDSLLITLKNSPADLKSVAYNALTRAYLSVSTDTSLIYCDSALVASEFSSNKSQKALALKNKGILFYYQGFYSEAMDYYNQSVQLYQNIADSSGIAAVNNNMAIVYELIGDYDDAIEHHLKALHFYESKGSPNEIARSYTNIGTVYGAIENYSKSLFYQKKALEIYTLQKNSMGIANIYNNMGTDFTELQQFDSALFFHQKSLEIRLEINDTRGISTSLINVGNGMKNLKRYNEAIQYFDKALNLVKTLNDQRSTVSVLLSKSQLLMVLERYTEAETTLEEVSGLTGHYNFPIFQRDLYFNYSELYSAMRENKKALEYLKKYITLKDSLLKQESTNYIADLETKYQFEKKNQQITYQNEQLIQQNLEIKKNKLIAGLVFALLLVALSLLFITAWAFRTKLKSHKKIEEQNELLIKQKNQITDSIHYAERIQKAVLPNETSLKQFRKNSFLIYLPKDIVSGDFIWVKKIETQLVVAIADCTGHGVPGAFMSMLGISFLNEIPIGSYLKNPNMILDEMRIFIKNSLNQKGIIGEAKDGIHINILVFNETFSEFLYASASHPAVIIRNGKIIDLNYDKQPIGIYYKETPFNTYNQKIEKDDTLYCYTDGIVDQFNKFGNQRFTSKRFKELLQNITTLDLDQQKKRIFSEFESWKGTTEQIDDITIAGFRF